MDEMHSEIPTMKVPPAPWCGVSLAAIPHGFYHTHPLHHMESGRVVTRALGKEGDWRDARATVSALCAVVATAWRMLV
jgi:hypothetical protein